MTDNSLFLEVAAEGVGTVGVEWDLTALAAADRDDAMRPFALGGDFDPERWELARMVSGALGDGRLLAVAALRPRGAAGHGDDAIGGALVHEGAVIVLDEVLLSVEYGPDGEPRRIGLEIYERPDSLPLRIAGDRTGRTAAGDATFELRAGGSEGAGLLTTLKPG